MVFFAIFIDFPESFAKTCYLPTIYWGDSTVLWNTRWKITDYFWTIPIMQERDKSKENIWFAWVIYCHIFICMQQFFYAKEEMFNRWKEGGVFPSNCGCLLQFYLRENWKFKNYLENFKITPKIWKLPRKFKNYLENLKVTPKIWKLTRKFKN